MTRLALLAATTAAVAILTACGSESTPGSASSASSTDSAPVPTSAPAAPSVEKTPQATADPCAVVTREYLITTLRMTGGARFPLADLEQPRCSGNYATARSVPDGKTQPSMYLFHYAEQEGHVHWRVIGLGSALDCVSNDGVPAEAARRIGCGR